jgi:hypothetical protein
LELTSQLAPSIILKEARENIEIEPVQLIIKEKFGPDRSAAADLNSSTLASSELTESQTFRGNN